MSDGNRSCLGPFLLVIGVVAAGYFLFSKGYLARFSNVNSELQRVSVEINKTTPKLLDEYTRLDSTTVERDRTIAFNLTIINFAGKDLPPQAATLLRNRNLAEYRSNPRMKAVRDAGITVRFRYHSQFGVPLMEFTVGPKDL